MTTGTADDSLKYWSIYLKVQLILIQYDAKLLKLSNIIFLKTQKLILKY